MLIATIGRKIDIKFAYMQFFVYLCTPKMKRILNILLFAVLFAVTAAAETVTLRSGKVITGTILIQNDEVVIIRDANGARHQYPAAEVLSVSSSDAREEEEHHAQPDNP